MLTIVLQAGGKSTRMGGDKALMPFLGIPLIERLRDRFQILDSEIMVISNDFAGYEYLGLPLHKDVLPDRGALGGLFTALSAAKTEYVGLIAGDMPFASPQLLARLFEEIKSSGADAALPSTSGGLEPLHGLYRRATCKPLVQDAISRDLWRLNSWHDSADILILNPIQSAAAAGSEFTFLNLNTPEEFAAAEKIARENNLQ